jgi:hypothetical protein
VTGAAEQISEMPPTVSSDEYAEFISQINLRRIWLNEAHVKNYRGFRTPEHATVNMASTERWEQDDRGFIAFQKWDVTFADRDTDHVHAELTAEFGLHFSSDIPMTEPIFEIFADANLPVNTWPYLREFLGSTLSRMNWFPFTLPALKRGTKRPSNQRRPAARTRKRRPPANEAPSSE